jgi:hypothetical protein
MILEDQKYETKVLKDHRVTSSEGTGGVEVYIHPFFTPGKETRYPLCTRWA